eukprot:gb/GEZJ01005839.1/.p1 GENE.gb/GEZJ01005839.1/~~gb/GEZJ01005839.1/.p1  ORF type:complete len:107 (+),score=6.11 gb/GEZJ01005839.1/:138-458(+)
MVFAENSAFQWNDSFIRPTPNTHRLSASTLENRPRRNIRNLQLLPPTGHHVLGPLSVNELCRPSPNHYPSPSLSPPDSEILLDRFRFVGQHLHLCLNPTPLLFLPD